MFFFKAALCFVTAFAVTWPGNLYGLQCDSSQKAIGFSQVDISPERAIPMGGYGTYLFSSRRRGPMERVFMTGFYSTPLIEKLRI